MHFFLICLQVICIVSVIIAATLAPSESLLSNNQAVSLFSDIAEIVQRERVVNLRTSLNDSDTIAHYILNETSSSSGTLNNTEGLIRFKVQDCPTTLDFHAFGPSIPANVLLQSITAAIAIAFEFVRSGNGHKNIHLGWFRYQQPFFEGGVVDFAVGDFKEIGRPINYLVLCDILRGIAEFMMLPQYGYHEIRFEVEVKGSGYVASGRVNYTPPPVTIA